MYFVVGFMSFDITSSNGIVENRNSIRRLTLNSKTMEWILSCMREVSKVLVNFVRRWKRRDNFSGTFCSRNFNKFSR